MATLPTPYVRGYEEFKMSEGRHMEKLIDFWRLAHEALRSARVSLVLVPPPVEIRDNNIVSACSSRKSLGWGFWYRVTCRVLPSLLYKWTRSCNYCCIILFWRSWNDVHWGGVFLQQSRGETAAVEGRDTPRKHARFPFDTVYSGSFSADRSYRFTPNL